MQLLMRQSRTWIRIPGSRHAVDYVQESDRAATDAFNRGVILAATGDPDTALKAYHEALRHAGPELAPKVAFNIAILKAHDLSAAASAYRAAIATGHEDVAPKAAFNLACLLEQHGDIEGAKRALQQAIDFEHKDVTPKAALKLEQFRRKERAVTASPASGRRSEPSLDWHCARRRAQGHARCWPSAKKRRSRTRRSPGHAA